MESVRRTLKPSKLEPGSVAYNTNKALVELISEVDGGIKHDQGKVRYDLLPPELEEAVATILTFGAQKYGDRNWEKGMDWGRVYRALRSHLNAFWRGEDLDPESNHPHLWHAACNIAFLIAYSERKVGKDDRQETYGLRLRDNPNKS